MENWRQEILLPVHRASVGGRFRRPLHHVQRHREVAQRRRPIHNIILQVCSFILCHFASTKVFIRCKLAENK